MLYRYTPEIKGTASILTSKGKLSSSSGINTIEDELWVVLKDLPEVKAKIDAGIIVPMGTSLPKAQLVNANSATKAQLVALPGVGAATADRIIAGRPYTEMKDIKEASKLPDSDWSKVESLITV